MTFRQVQEGESFWVLVYTKAGEEKKAEINLKLQGFETFLPLILPDNNAKSDSELTPIFPRYLFVKIKSNENNWSVINSTYGVKKLVLFTDKLVPIPKEIIQEIKAKLNHRKVYKKNITFVEHKEGDDVSIVKGRFAGLEAVFLSKKSQDRVRLLLKFLNSTVIAELNKSHISDKEVTSDFKF